MYPPKRRKYRPTGGKRKEPKNTASKGKGLRVSELQAAMNASEIR